MPIPAGLQSLSQSCAGLTFEEVALTISAFWAVAAHDKRSIACTGLADIRGRTIVPVVARGGVVEREAAEFVSHESSVHGFRHRSSVQLPYRFRLYKCLPGCKPFHRHSLLPLPCECSPHSGSNCLRCRPSRHHNRLEGLLYTPHRNRCRLRCRGFRLHMGLSSGCRRRPGPEGKGHPCRRRRHRNRSPEPRIFLAHRSPPPYTGPRRYRLPDPTG